MKSIDKTSKNMIIVQLIEQFIKSGSLVRITVVKQRGVRFSIPCRVLNFDMENSLLSAYHVDEKQVYLLHLNEIDDIIV